MPIRARVGAQRLGSPAASKGGRRLCARSRQELRLLWAGGTLTGRSASFRNFEQDFRYWGAVGIQSCIFTARVLLLVVSPRHTGPRCETQLLCCQRDVGLRLSTAGGVLIRPPWPDEATSCREGGSRLRVPVTGRNHEDITTIMPATGTSTQQGLVLI